MRQARLIRDTTCEGDRCRYLQYIQLVILKRSAYDTLLVENEGNKEVNKRFSFFGKYFQVLLKYFIFDLCIEMFTEQHVT